MDEHVSYRLLVHMSHCCLEHGCDYAHSVAQNAECPVVSGQVDQEYPCARCTEDAEKIAWISPIVRKFLGEILQSGVVDPLIDALEAKAKEV